MSVARKRKDRDRVRKNLLVQMNNEQCAHCGVTGPDCIFDFHHIKGGGNREGAVGHRMRQVSHKEFREKIIPEIMEECIMLYANCHRIEHWA